jgi:hypothetical protein
VTTMEEKFIKLQNIIDIVATFYFGMDNQYLGPVDPTAIISFGSSNFKVNVLILAERVPSMYVPHPLGPDHIEAVMVYLDDEYEFKYHDPIENELKGLSVLIGDSTYSYDGTVEGASEFFKEKNWYFDILYKR